MNKKYLSCFNSVFDLEESAIWRKGIYASIVLSFGKKHCQILISNVIEQDFTQRAHTLIGSNKAKYVLKNVLAVPVQCVKCSTNR